MLHESWSPNVVFVSGFYFKEKMIETKESGKNYSRNVNLTNKVGQMNDKNE